VTIVPTSASEKWDAAAEAVKKAKGKWVVVVDEADRPRNDKAKERLSRRGLDVMVVSRLGHETTGRPWNGWRTWAKTL
jgi:hypothetical protein